MIDTPLIETCEGSRAEEILNSPGFYVESFGNQFGINSDPVLLELLEDPNPESARPNTVKTLQQQPPSSSQRTPSRR